MYVPLVGCELLHEFPRQYGRQLRHSVLQRRLQLVEIVQSEVADVDQTADFQLAEVVINHFLVVLLSLLALHFLKLMADPLRYFLSKVDVAAFSLALGRASPIAIGTTHTGVFLELLVGFQDEQTPLINEHLQLVRV